MHTFHIFVTCKLNAINKKSTTQNFDKPKHSEAADTLYVCGSYLII